MACLIRLSLILCLVTVNLGISHSKSQLIHLDEGNWEEMLSGEWMVEFYAPWCPACKALQPVWDEFSSWRNKPELSVGQVDVTTSPGLSGRFMVTALPTIFHVINGEFRQYKGARDRDSFLSFIEEEKWRTVETIPSWKSPSSIQMAVVSHFFKLSQILRTIHNKLMEDYGLPNWGSYLIFAVVTIIMGSLLGLMMVCCFDFVHPPKAVHRRAPTAGGKETGPEDSEDELVEEELVDDRSVETNTARKRKIRKTD